MMFRSRKKRKPLSELEHLVMEAVWESPAVTADEVRARLARRHPMKESTARTVLKRLEEKGYVTHTVRGRTNVYKSAEGSESVAVRAVCQIIDRFCNGSVEQLLVGMVSHEVMDERELKLLAERIAERRKGAREA